MSEWVHTNVGFINPERIERVTSAPESRQGSYRSRLYLTNGEVALAYGSCEDVAERLATVVAVTALPGFSLVLAIKDSDGLFCASEGEPIIAWRVHRGLPPMPVTVSGDEDLSNRWAVKYPDGSLCEGGDRYSGTDGWIACVNEEEKKLSEKTVARVAGRKD
jgi:hypothetical protein